MLMIVMNIIVNVLNLTINLIVGGTGVVGKLFRQGLYIS